MEAGHRPAGTARAARRARHPRRLAAGDPRANRAAARARLAGCLAPGGVFACQIPQSYHEHWHIELRHAAAQGAWSSKLTGVDGVQPSPDPKDLYRWLAPLCTSVDIWTTTYLHVLDGDNPVVDWMTGTGLRPYLQALPDPAERDAFVDYYSQLMHRRFPKEPDGVTLFPFPRLFVVARR